jgi:hypothetical protein
VRDAGGEKLLNNHVNLLEAGVKVRRLGHRPLYQLEMPTENERNHPSCTQQDYAVSSHPPIPFSAT